MAIMLILKSLTILIAWARKRSRACLKVPSEAAPRHAHAAVGGGRHLARQSRKSGGRREQHDVFQLSQHSRDRDQENIGRSDFGSTRKSCGTANWTTSTTSCALQACTRSMTSPCSTRTPLDRMLLAQAKSEGISLLTSESIMRKIPTRWCLCRRRRE